VASQELFIVYRLFDRQVTFRCHALMACSSREHQAMTDLAISISAALRDAQLQRLEASLAAKTPTKAQAKPPSDNDKRASVRG
tara:strand:- start:288 stop:536 length:249 start_codon:yes stop_codon:yes gene_type:complete